MEDEKGKRKFPHLMGAMELESACTIDRDGSGSIDEAAEGIDLHTPVIHPFEQRIDPETGHVKYHKKQMDYSEGQNPKE